MGSADRQVGNLATAVVAMDVVEGLAELPLEQFVVHANLQLSDIAEDQHVLRSRDDVYNYYYSYNNIWYNHTYYNTHNHHGLCYVEEEDLVGEHFIRSEVLLKRKISWRRKLKWRVTRLMEEGSVLSLLRSVLALTPQSKFLDDDALTDACERNTMRRLSKTYRNTLVARCF